MPLYFMTLAEEAEPELTSDTQAEWLDRLEDEHDNLRAALRWARQPGDTGGGDGSKQQGPATAVVIGLRIAVAIFQYWLTRGYFSEGREQLEGMLSLLPALPPFSPRDHDALPATQYSLRARAYNGAGLLAHRQGDYAAASAALEQGLAIGREMGDKASMARSLNVLGNVTDGQGDYPEAQSLYEQSLALFRELGDKAGTANEFGNLGNIAVSQADYATARPLYEQSLALDRELGNKRGVAISLLNLGDMSYVEGDYQRAGSLYEQGLAQFRELEDKLGTAVALNDLGSVAQGQGDYATARSQFEQCLPLFEELGDKRGVATTLNALGGIACTQGDYPIAASFFEQGLDLFKGMEDKRSIAVSLMGLGAIGSGVGATRGKEDLGGVEAAQRGTRLLGASEALLESIGAVLEAVDRALYTQAIEFGSLAAGG